MLQEDRVWEDSLRCQQNAVSCDVSFIKHSLSGSLVNKDPQINEDLGERVKMILKVS